MIRIAETWDDVFTANEERIQAIARNTAEVKAQLYVEQERDREKPLSFTFCVWSISEDIGEALHNAGYDFDVLGVLHRREFAMLALRAAGYPEDRR